ncbi:PhoH family protein [Engelhardtia mirabilis]|uniref:PhoH-like protein n=1 Tax=Engelhardtia mirabilis TaxID=2528011 RepID=A0A518BPV5_9BACT|nr:PhoH-like protein [Planctomycetes bacterium Pla133]QDV03323.1 PhoH-like protein [Planctomycetes bacterium Pla86]
MLELTIPLRSHDEAILVLGPYDRHAKLLRDALDIELFTRGGNLRLKGEPAAVEEARKRLEHLLGKHRKGRELHPTTIEEILGAGLPAGTVQDRTAVVTRDPDSPEREFGAADGGRSRGPRRRVQVSRPRAVEPRSQNQRRYLEAIERHALTFGLGSAGTGKTFLAVVAAVRALRAGEVRRIIISRPVVEAGERLGFLPGDLQAKLDPYIRPIYDALYEIIPFEDVGQLAEAGVLEIAPLAYMRGRTLSHAFVILDEAQNTTPGQMKMFLTRLGEGGRMVVTGDPTQNDLDTRQPSGLVDAVRRVRGFAGIGVVEFNAGDIVRHPLVEQIVRAYEAPVRDLTKPDPSSRDGRDGDGAAVENP